MNIYEQCCIYALQTRWFTLLWSFGADKVIKSKGLVC